MYSPWNVSAQRPFAEASVPLRRFPSPADFQAGSAPAPSQNRLAYPASVQSVDHVAIELDAPDKTLLRSPAAPLLPPEASMARPAWSTLWSAARAGTLDDWTYWQHNSERYRRAAVAAVMLSLWSGFAGVGYLAYADVQKEKAAAAAASASAAAMAGLVAGATATAAAVATATAKAAGWTAAGVV